ncbi:MAG: hypothetical protein IJ108_02305 [Eubacterium sp.]|nr:hypothetical protein [Eubacterium sp.]
MHFKKYLAIILTAAVLGTGVMAGCSTNTSQVSVESEAQTGSAIISSTFMGTVTAVDGNTVTLSLEEEGSADGAGSAAPGENGDEMGTPPEKPEGAPDGTSDSGQTGGMPDGNAPQQSTNEITVNEDGTITDGQALLIDDTTVVLTIADESVVAEDVDLAEGSALTVTVDDNGSITSITAGMQGSPGQGGPGGGTSAADISYSAATEFTSDANESGKTYASTGTDEEAVLVTEGANVTLSDSTITRDSDDSSGGDNASFYGVGAAALVTDGTLTIDEADITTDAAGGAGVFAYGDGTAYVNNAVVRTSQNTSGGLHAAGGGTLYAWDCDVETDGGSAAAIRSDRGGGTMVIDGGTYTSNGSGSPAVYCTADITVNDADLNATGAEGICIEGLNTLRLYDTDLTCNMPDDSQNDITWSVILYQSMSGDSEEGNSTFSMQGGSITSENGGLFYSTNTESTFYLNDVDIQMAEDDAFFLQVTGNSNQRGWGSTGSNGADTSFTADAQTMEGDVIYDSISNLDFYMENGSTLTGAFVDDETWAGDGGSGECNVYISSDSTWIVTGDSTVTNLYNEGTIKDASGNTVTIKDTDGNVLVKGTSSYTITVKYYDTSADFSGASEASAYEAVDSPFES